jgi:hypothetical protein
MHELYEGVFLERRKINQRRHLPTSSNPVVLAEDDPGVEADTPVESPSQPDRKQRNVRKQPASVERRESLRDRAAKLTGRTSR